jgi:hypothetical protein
MDASLTLVESPLVLISKSHCHHPLVKPKSKKLKRSHVEHRGRKNSQNSKTQRPTSAGPARSDWELGRSPLACVTDGSRIASGRDVVNLKHGIVIFIIVVVFVRQRAGGAQCILALAALNREPGASRSPAPPGNCGARVRPELGDQPGRRSYINSAFPRGWETVTWRPGQGQTVVKVQRHNMIIPTSCYESPRGPTAWIE